ncbi:MAG: hypothetical protein HYT39_03670 [Candidatus Sungbacteria bacterium]|nr:hypothetical protein [Candidatus Sungbacteria bacterium]
MNVTSLVKKFWAQSTEFLAAAVSGFLGAELSTGGWRQQLGGVLGKQLKPRELDRNQVREDLVALGQEGGALLKLLDKANRKGFYRDPLGKRRREEWTVEMLRLLHPQDETKRRQAYIALNRLLASGNIQRFFTELEILDNNGLEQRLSVVLDIAEEYWRKVRAAAVAADAGLAPVNRVHLNFNDWLRRVNQREQRRWF